MKYSMILQRALQITWRHRALWVFGLLGAFSRSLYDAQQIRTILQQLSEFAYPPGVLDSTLSRSGLLGVVGLCGWLLVGFLLAIWLGTLMWGAIITMVDEVEQTGTTTLAHGYRAGTACWWRVFGLQLLIGIAVLIVLLPALAGLLLSAPSSPYEYADSRPGLTLPCCCGLSMLPVGLLLAIGLGLLESLAIPKCVLEERGATDSLGMGWQMLRANAGRVIVFSLLLLLVTLPITVPMIGLASGGDLLVEPVARLIREATASSTLTALGILAIHLVLGIIDILLTGILSTFGITVWTLVYRELSTREQAAASTGSAIPPVMPQPPLLPS